MDGEDDRRSAMDAVVQRLRRGLAAVGAPPLLHPEEPAALAELAAAVAPLRLPAEVERFWRLVDGESSSLTCFPHPHARRPDFALECWRQHRQQPGLTPALLLPVGYESHAFLLVELDGPRGGGGACFTWAYDGEEPFVLVAVDLTTYLDVAAATLESGPVAHELDERAFHRALRRRLRQHPHPTYGSAAEIDWNPASWPGHWLESVGPAALEQHARGATTSLAALAGRGSSPGTAGRVHARVRGIWGFPDGLRATVDDGTGLLDVWCPTSVTMFGPACDGRYEFDVVTTDDAPHDARAEAIAVRLLDTEP